MSGGGFPGSDGAMGGPVVPTPYHEVAHCLNAGGMGRIDYETESFVVNAGIPILEPGARTGKSTTDVRAGLGVGDDGDPMYTLQAGKQHGVAATIAFSSKDYGADATEGGATAEVGGEVATALRASTGGGDKPHVLAMGLIDTTGHQGDRFVAPGDITQALSASAGNNAGGGGTCLLAPGLAVRRLTPTECERLQGFPDGHTDVPYRKKPAADGPRYKALGNSMAVPCMRWIGSRIQRHLDGDL